MDYPADASPLGSFEQRPRVLDREIEGDLAMRVPHPVGVVEDARSLHRVAQPIGVGEVQGSRLHPTAEGVLRIRAAGKCPHADALVKQTPGDVPARIAEGASDDGEVGVRYRVPFLTCSLKVGEPRFKQLLAAYLMFVLRWYSFTPPQLSKFREKVLTNWPAEMSHSTYGECDIDAQRTDETQDPQQPAG